MKKQQIKSKKRVTDFGEVYTDIQQVKDMLDLIPEDAAQIGTTYFEPAMGDGNFLEEILRRKLDKALSEADSKEELRINILRSVMSIYGVDIQKDNVLEARKRMSSVLFDAIPEHLHASLDTLLLKAINKVIQRNLICGNTLKCIAETGEPLVFCEWDITDSGYIVCREYRFDDMLANGGETNVCICAHRYSWLIPKKAKEAA